MEEKNSTSRIFADFPTNPISLDSSIGFSEKLLQEDLNSGSFDMTSSPNWLPAAIILPLAAVIALTLAVVCMMTRASRLFRVRKTVLVTDPAMLSNLHAVNNVAYVGVGSELNGSPAYINGKNNPAFDSAGVVDKESLSKL